MPHHYPKNTTEVSYWCNTCNRLTMHQVYNGRLGACVEEHHKAKEQNPGEEPEQLSMFDERRLK